MVRRLALTIALAVSAVLSSCTSGGGNTQKAAPSTTQTTGAAAGAAGATSSTTQRTEDSGGGTAPRGGIDAAENAAAPSSRRQSSLARRLVYYYERRTMFEGKWDEYAQSTYWDVEQQVDGGTVRAMWRQRVNEGSGVTEDRELTWRGDTAYGQSMTSTAGDYGSCDWQPAVPYVLARTPGASATFDSQCEFTNEVDGSKQPAFVKGSVRMVEQQDIELHGRRHRVWAIERHWETRTRRDAPVQFDITSTSWWSDDLQMVVKHKAYMVFAPSSPSSRQEMDVKMELTDIK